MRDLRLTGPDMGWSFCLRPGVNRAGRSPENDLHGPEASGVRSRTFAGKAVPSAVVIAAVFIIASPALVGVAASDTFAIAAEEQIDFNGQNVTANSFDSTDPQFSTTGKYDPTKVKDQGDLISNEGVTNSF